MCKTLSRKSLPIMQQVLLGEPHTKSCVYVCVNGGPTVNITPQCLCGSPLESQSRCGLSRPVLSVETGASAAMMAGISVSDGNSCIIVNAMCCSIRLLLDRHMPKFLSSSSEERHWSAVHVVTGCSGTGRLSQL